MSLLIGFLTFILVVAALFLILLVLVQLPKKEAGAGIAFGGAATDALFGAGSGNALTKMTKYAAGFFLLMALVLSALNSHRHQSSIRNLQEELARKSANAPLITPPQTPAMVNSNTAKVMPAPAVTPNAGSLNNTGAVQSLNLNGTNSPVSTGSKAPAPATQAPQK